MAWGSGQDDSGRHRGSMVQGEILEQRLRDGGGYEIKVKLPGGFVLDKIPVAAGNRFVGAGASHTAWLSIRNGDDNQYEAQHLAGDPSTEFTPNKPTGFFQNPANKNQRVSMDADGAHIDTDGKPVGFHNDTYKFAPDGKMTGPSGVTMDFTTGILSGSALSINLNTGAIIGNITLTGNLTANGNISDNVNTP